MESRPKLWSLISTHVEESLDLEESLDSTQVQQLSVHDINNFEDEDDLEEVVIL